MLGSYRKQIYIPYTRDIHLLLEHLKNLPDETTVGAIIDRLTSLLLPQGLESYEYKLKLVHKLDRVEVDRNIDLKVIRSYDPNTFELRLFLNTSMPLTVFKV